MKLTESKLRSIIRNEIQKLNEKVADKLFLIGDIVWLLFDPNSGITAKLKNKDSYLTSKSNDSNYDDIVKDIIKWTKNEKSIYNKNNKEIYKIPFYNYSQDLDRDKSPIWNDSIKPKNFKYMVIIKEQNYYIINFFDSKTAAKSWE